MLGIGIDTGGTCTDAVIFDSKSRKVLSWAKTLTTKNDLKIGILEAMRGLAPDLLHKAEYIALSTTLATNACVEKKGGRAKLILMGTTRKTLEWIGMAPIYDSGSSLGYDKLPGQMKADKDVGCKPFKNHHLEQLRLVYR